ncbi:MAG: hypothetical protein GFH27_549357n16 [Chloroflexi bacterium AL-W]|nr:hypothetical protein [Chloroflexi bacterium AL-N1]NOK70653.1 hypothetical protein [Chloroflexi bacterium AL-N10]NOK78472.1 hypothetical protein [Chloroflexi bacterium AL-N5]NOK85556.1 hypothetical protein [Chloroflexi bacterium AL-W]NOK92470.1 hypothetical protein [Chloroflexi bacterium AL-N15]
MTRHPRNESLLRVRGHLTERYAQALHHIRNLDCPLDEFDIDRLGWSPQLAALLGNDYLGNNALRYAIILSTDQATVPVLYQRFSYEAPLIEKVYRDARPTLLNLIEHESVVVEFDNGLTFCHNAVDVLGIQSVKVRIETPSQILTKSSELLELAGGLNEQARLLNEHYIDKMLALAQDIGDPRRRPIPPRLQRTIGSLWAEVDGAVYVFRPHTGQKQDPIVVATRPDILHDLPVVALEIGDPLVVGALHNGGFLRYSPESALLKRRLNNLILDTLLTANEPGIAATATAQRRQLERSSKAQAMLPKVYWELNTLQQHLAAGGSFDPSRLSVEAKWALSAPNRSITVASNLLARFVRYDYVLQTHRQWRHLQAEWDRYSPAKQHYLTQSFPQLVVGLATIVTPTTH